MPTRAAVPTSRPSAAASPTDVRPSPAGSAAVSRSRTAAVQADRALDQAAAAIAAERYPVADAALDRAARALPAVTAADGKVDLQRRYDLLRTRLDGLLADDAPATTRPSTARPEKTAAPTPKASPRSSKGPSVRQSREPRAEPTARPTRKAPKATAKPTPRASRTPVVPGLSEGRGKD